MPWQEVMGKYKSGDLHSGSKTGPKVKSRNQAIAIMLHEKGSSKEEYHSEDSGPMKGLKKAKPKTKDDKDGDE